MRMASTLPTLYGSPYRLVPKALALRAVQIRGSCLNGLGVSLTGLRIVEN